MAGRLVSRRYFGREAGYRLAGDRVHGDLALVRAQGGENQPVVRQDRFHDLRDPVEDPAHIERLGHHREQRVDRVEAAAPCRVETPEPLVLERQAQEVGDRLDGRLVPGREGALARRREPERAGQPPAREQGSAQERPDSLLEDLAVHGEARVELVRRIVDQPDPAELRPDGGREVSQRKGAAEILGHEAAGDGIAPHRVRCLEAGHPHRIEGKKGGCGFGHAREDIFQLERLADRPGDATEGGYLRIGNRL